MIHVAVSYWRLRYNSSSFGLVLYDSAANEKGEAKFARGMGIGIEREEEEARDLLLGRRHISLSLLLSLLHDEERRTGAS